MDQLDLAGAWELSLAEGKSPVLLPEAVTMDVPGDNITALLRAGVAMNGVQVVSSSNMFGRVRVELPTGLLKAGENTIEILFKSAEIAATQCAAQLTYPIPYSTYAVQSPHRNLIRKVQCHSGWDWGPNLMVSGVNGTICLAACRTLDPS